MLPDEGRSPSFIDQILEHALETLSENPAFDEETLRRLSELAGSADLNKFERVVEALSTSKGK